MPELETENSKLCTVHEEDVKEGGSMNKVLNTTELFESILSFLPTQDLLLSQRVSEHFRDTIKTSVIL